MKTGLTLFFHLPLSDLEGDRITLFNTLDFGIFFDSTINKVYIEVNPSAAPAPIRLSECILNIKPPTPITKATVFAPTATATASNTASPSAGSKVHHVNVICDNCDKDIYGFRYKCMECWDFDLCMDCEAKMTHKEHIMMRIPNPKDADFVSIICEFSKIPSR